MILFTGRGSSGSWIVRGEQVGGKVGKAVKQANLKQCSAADMIVAVKRVNPQLLDAIRRSRKPWVLDVVDFYPQPLCTAWDRETAIAWVKGQIRKLKPSGVIWPNRRMMEDCSTGLPETVIYHHHRPELSPIKPSREVRNIGYEGSEKYLGEWLRPIVKECANRGWQFHVNTKPVDQLDVVLALRGKEFDGYAQRHWKSNVKLSNAQGAETAFIGLPECGYLETCSLIDIFIESPTELSRALDEVSTVDHRFKSALAHKKITLDDVASQYRAFLSGL